MSTSGQGLSKTLDEGATLRARVVELQRENDLLKQAQRAHTEAGRGLQTSGNEEMSEGEYLQHIYTAAPIGLCCFDKELRYVFVNEWLAEINGLSVEQHLGRSISEVLPDVAAGVEAQLRQVIETGEPVVEGTVEAETAAQPGVKRNFEHHYDAVRSADGAIVGVSCVVQDVTERIQAEEALRLAHEELEGKVLERTEELLAANNSLQESEERLALALEATSEGLWDWNLATGEVFYSPQWCKALGFDPSEVDPHGRFWEKLVHPEDLPRLTEVLNAHFQQKTENYECQIRLRTKSGAYRWTLDRGKVVARDEDGKPLRMVGVDVDITERKRAEVQARQLQADLAHMSRLSSMGEMATGLAHELNQPLTAIANYAQGCVRRLKSNAISQEELEGILGRIATQARRSSSIIRSLGNLVRKSSALRTDIDVNRSIMEVAELANAEAAQHRVKARFELEPNLPPVKADQTQLQQVILNLVQNGCEAIEDAPQSRREVTVRTKQCDDSYLEIIVSDSGAGIPEALGERLFEPFVTTKAHGIGMGLAISRSIVESHGGRLWATPNPDQGTTFHFTLPIVGGISVDE